jgi:hypothetical protein
MKRGGLTRRRMLGLMGTAAACGLGGRGGVEAAHVYPAQ